MRIGIVRTGFATALGLSLVALLAVPGGAANAISYTGISEGSGLRIILAPGGTVALDRGGAITKAAVDSKPSASGSGEGVSGVESATASSSAPPDGPEQSASGGGFTNLGQADVLTASVDAGEASSVSEAEDGTPSTESTARFALLTITAGSEAVLQVVIEVTSAVTKASAKAKGANVSSSSTSEGVIVSLDIQAAVLQDVKDELQEPLCTNLGGVNEQLGAACDEAFEATEGSVRFASIEVGQGQVTCTYNGKDPDATGQGAILKATILGQELPVVSGPEPVTLGEGTPLETTLGAGSFEKQISTGDQDEVTARAGGAFLDLLGGQVRLAFSTSTCGIAATVPPDEVLAATGGQVAMYLLGGSGLLAVALGARGLLRRRRHEG